VFEFQTTPLGTVDANYLNNDSDLITPADATKLKKYIAKTEISKFDEIIHAATPISRYTETYKFIDDRNTWISIDNKSNIAPTAADAKSNITTNAANAKPESRISSVFDVGNLTGDRNSVQTTSYGDAEPASGKKVPSTLRDDVIEALADKNRKTKPTPNNPVSSRSHVIIFIEYTDRKINARVENANPPNSAKLAICDFAGVENEFA
jgi:hypothetical protein